MIKRVVAVLVLLGSIFILPFWVSATLGIVGMFYFRKFYEAPIIFLISDLLYGVHTPKLGNILFFSFIVSMLVFLLIEFLKKKLKYYR